MVKAWIAAGALIFASATVNAQLLFEPVTVHPAAVNRDAPWLILIDDSWADGCGGTVQTRVSPQLIEIEGTLSSPMLGQVCTAALVPFKQLINPADLVPQGFVFADNVTINYLVDNGNGAQLRYSRQMQFSSQPNQTVRAQPGGWTTGLLQSSGLFIDQQGGILSAALFDYGTDNLASWHYAAGPVNGSVFVADLSTFGLINCVTAPCDRAAPVADGKIYMLLRGANEAIVSYRQIPFPGSVVNDSDDAVVYHRLDFRRSAQLPLDPIDGDLPLPDLVGQWVGGMVNADLGVDDFRSMRIEYAGFDDSRGVRSYRYNVFPAAIGEPSFQIDCADNRPLDGPVGCSLQGYRYGSGQGVACDAFFEFAAVAEESVRAAAQCGDTTLAFELYRRD